jgi:phosphoribosylformimino-5-aminoimidazole carboxamide ribotide isomerase
VATHGWTESSTLTVERALSIFSSASAFVITDISRDGMLQGPDVEGLRVAVKSTSTDVIASGGVGSLEHIRHLSAIAGLAGVITGKALYENKFTVAEALRAVGDTGRMRS